MIALIAEGSSRAPHEVALGELDLRGVKLHSSLFVFDLQAITELGKARRRAEKEAGDG